MALLIGCSNEKSETATSAESHEHGDSEETSVTNRISIPEQVRRNLGITFAKVEMRRVASTLRLPGRFELLPSARREYHAPLAGKIELLVRQYDVVSTGTALYQLESPDWRRLQQEMADARAHVGATSASLVLAQVATSGGVSATSVIANRLAAGMRHIDNLKSSVAVSEARLAQLEKIHKIAGGKLGEITEAQTKIAEAKSALSQAEEEKADLERESLRQSTEGAGAFTAKISLDASLDAKKSEYEAALLRLKVARVSASAVLAVPEGELDRQVPSSDGGTEPLWQSVRTITIRAAEPGVVQTIEATNGAYLEVTKTILVVADPAQVRFRAIALQSDLERLRDGISARILPPAKGVDEHDHPDLPGVLTLAQEADSVRRSLDVIITPQTQEHWARTGVTSYVEAVLDETEEPVTAIPVPAVLQDDLQRIFFKRDSGDPDKAIRMEADLGMSDGQWIAVESGVKAGDEVVLGGIYQLKLTGGGKVSEAGHFHADGTFHAGKH